MSLEIGKVGYPSCPSSKTKIQFFYIPHPCLEGMWLRIPKKDDKNNNYNLSGSTSRIYTWVELSARFGTVTLKVSRRSLYIQIRLKLNHEDFHTQTLNVWYLYLQIFILLAKPPLVFPWSPKIFEWFSGKTIVLVRVYKQQFQGTVLWMVFDFQGIKNSGLLDTDASNQDESCKL